MKRYYILLMSVAMLLSCSEKNDNYSNYLPVQYLDWDATWGIINLQDGSNVCKNEFKNKPTRVYDDIIIVNTDGKGDDIININNVNQILNKKSFEKILPFGNEETTFASIKDYVNIHVIDKEGNIVNVLKEDVAEIVKSIGESVVAFKTFSEKWGIMSHSGEIILPEKYDHIYRFNEGVAVAFNKEGDKITYFFINDKGEELYSFTNQKYNSVGKICHHGLFTIGKGSLLALIDKTGKEVFQIGSVKHNKLADALLNTYYDGENYVYYENDSYGLKDEDGNIIIRSKYSSITPIGDCLYIVGKRSGYSADYGIVNSKDETIIGFIAKEIHYVGNNRILVKKERSYGFELMDLDGNNYTESSTQKIDEFANEEEYRYVSPYYLQHLAQIEEEKRQKEQEEKIQAINGDAQKYIQLHDLNRYSNDTFDVLFYQEHAKADMTASLPGQDVLSATFDLKYDKLEVQIGPYEAEFSPDMSILYLKLNKNNPVKLTRKE